jgi:N-acetylmuramate 1-kinase
VSTLPPDAATHLSAWIGEGWSAQPLAGDASVRAYYRVTAADGRTYMLAYYPEEVRGQLARSLAAFRALESSVGPPAILHASDVATLQHDAGDRTIFDVLHEDREEGLRLYRLAVERLVALQQASDPGLNAAFNVAFFENELRMTREFFLERLMERDGKAFEEYATKICAEVATHPYVLCHRDYHGQNVHVQSTSIYVIDYQDLRMGPDTYDLASLLRDRAVAEIIGDEAELELVHQWARLSGAEGDVRSRYFATLLQRSLKVLGTFSRQPIERGRMHYLEFIPAALASVSRCIDELPAFAPLRDIVPLSIDLGEVRSRAARLSALSSQLSGRG